MGKWPGCLTEGPGVEKRNFEKAESLSSGAAGKQPSQLLEHGASGHTVFERSLNLLQSSQQPNDLCQMGNWSRLQAPPLVKHGLTHTFSTRNACRRAQERAALAQELRSVKEFF